MKTLSLCMIVKDSEKYIEQCISSVFTVVSEIIIVDTGSTDSTLEKIKQFSPKIYHYNWNNSFAEARNHSLEQATSDYILVLDSDEVLYDDDLPKLKELLENSNADGISIQFNNLTDENSEDSYNTHIGLRIFRNGYFHYEGNIHEQLTLNDPSYRPVLEISDIKVKHYGYLKSNAGLKKHQRNLPIIQEMLDKNPNDAFHLFNLGNEYMSLGNYSEALKYFELSDENKNLTMAYTPHLYFRRATCLQVLNRNEESLAVLAQGLIHYSKCTDMEFLRGKILTKLKRYTLAIDSFNNCIAMGEAPPTLRFFTETGEFRPIMEIASIYFLLEDYQKALDQYLKALKLNGNKYFVIYDVGKVLNRLFEDKNIVLLNLRSLFADYRFKSNVMITCDSLLNEGLIEQAKESINDIANSDALDMDDYFIKGRILFYDKEYESAFNMFESVIHPDTKKGVLPTTDNRAIEYMVACSLLNPSLKNSTIKIIEGLEESVEKSVLLAFLNSFEESLAKESLKTISVILSKILRVREFDQFEEALNVLNQVDSEEVLLGLADIYYLNNYPDMAVKTIIRSVKELDKINSAAVSILNKEFLM